MEWWITLIILGGLLLVALLSGIPVAFAFLSLNIIGFVGWVGNIESLSLLVPSAYSSISIFTLAAVPLFIFLGQAFFYLGLGKLMVDNLAKWIGRVPGSLSLLGICSGTAFAMMSGSSVSGVALFGSTLAPEMKSRGYADQMIYGPILASGSLAVIIPPSLLVVVIATLTQQSVGELLIAIIIPGFILAALYATYVLVRGHIQPHLAPAFGPPRVDWSERIKALVNILPFSILIFLVLGVIFFGVATPTEAASLGATGVIGLSAAYRKLNWQAIKTALMETISVTSMVLLIFMSATAFAQLLAITGVSGELGNLIIGLPVSPISKVICMQVVLIIMGMFIDDWSMIMITVPIFFPVIRSLGFDPVWFSILLVINMEMAAISPPFGLLLFTLKGVVPSATMGDIYRASIPILLIILVLLITLLIFPSLATFLPGLMR